MKTFSERNLVLTGAVGLVAVVAVVLTALNYQNLTFVNQTKRYSAYFADAGGLFTGAGVQVSGFAAGKVADIGLDGNRVKVDFTVDRHIKVGELTEAAIRTKSLLGTKILEVVPKGQGTLDGPIPLSRTVSPYQLPDALADLSRTISGLDTNQLSDSLSTLAETFADTPADLRDAVQGVARFAATLNSRDAELRDLLTNAAKVTGVLSKRSDQIAALVADTNTLLAQLRTQSAAVDNIFNSISTVSRQLKAFIAENRGELRPALEKLNGVLAIVDNRKERLQLAVKLLNKYAMSLGESVSSGPFFKAYIANLLPGQFVQPFIDAAFSDLGLDPHVLLPSQLSDPQTGQPGTPPLPAPSPRTGQGGEPRLNLPDAITGNPGDARYPYREPLPAPAPGGPPPGPPAVVPPAPTLTPLQVPAPGETEPTS
ncbi:MCE family protein [Mycolicibacterium septicum]|uniref:MCE family protein n=1 Tax=Mycolicibacterium septicum TaxID=98668 RepID=UPI0023609641|nr:MCE family protein [Mycolicibacterium septicum]